MKNWDDIWQFCFFTTLLGFIITQLHGNILFAILTLVMGILTLLAIFFKIKDSFSKKDIKSDPINEPIRKLWDNKDDEHWNDALEVSNE